MATHTPVPDHSKIDYSSHSAGGSGKRETGWRGGALKHICRGQRELERRGCENWASLDPAIGCYRGKRGGAEHRNSSSDNKTVAMNNGDWGQDNDTMASGKRQREISPASSVGDDSFSDRPKRRLSLSPLQVPNIEKMEPARLLSPSVSFSPTGSTSSSTSSTPLNTPRNCKVAFHSPVASSMESENVLGTKRGATAAMSATVFVNETKIFEAFTIPPCKGERGCRCGRTRCLKQYCQCFRADKRCNDDCMCDNCYNDGKHEKERGQAIRNIRVNHQSAFKGTALELENQTAQSSGGVVKAVRGCRCKKSKCQKKYCECFGAGLKCSANCLCEECGNGNENRGKNVTPATPARMTHKPLVGVLKHRRLAVELSISPEEGSTSAADTPPCILGLATTGAGLLEQPDTGDSLREQPVSGATTIPDSPAPGWNIDDEDDAIKFEEEEEKKDEDGMEFEHSVSASHALHAPRPPVAPLRQAMQGWGEDSPRAGVAGWHTSTRNPFLQSPPKSSGAAPGRHYLGGGAAAYGAPETSFATLARGESLLKSEEPPCTPISPAPKASGSATVPAVAEPSTVQPPPWAFAPPSIEMMDEVPMQPCSWGLSRNDSVDLVFV